MDHLHRRRYRARLRTLFWVVIMKRHYGETKAARQADYCARFSDLLLTRAPQLSGRIEWPAVLHYFHSGAPVADAVDQYCMARNII
ncbi:MAG: hypothetical protein EBT13_10940 [Rhodobacteraceae bacterium]|nr:hypothetical protein [Paracoccaceae bacterium]